MTDRIAASLAVFPQAFDLAQAKGLGLSLHGDHTFTLNDANGRWLTTLFSDRGGRQTILDVVTAYVEARERT